MRDALKMMAAAMLVLATALGSVDAREDAGGPYYDFAVFDYEDCQYDSAVKNLEIALKFNPDNPYYHHLLGKTHVRMERYPEALEHLERAAGLDADLPGLKFDMGFLNFKMSRFPEAYARFREIGENDPSWVLAQYYAGISLFRSADYDKALPFLVRAGERSPTLRTNSNYYAGVCYQKTGQTGKAVQMFQSVSQSDSKSLGSSAAMWLDSIQKGKKEIQPYNLYLRLSRRHDDNVRLEPLDLDYLYTDESDWLSIGYFSGGYNFFNRNGMIFGAGYSHYQSWYDRLEAYDLTGSIFRAYARYQVNNMVFGVTATPSYYWVESDSYLRRYQLSPDMTWRSGAGLIARFSLSWSDDTYFQYPNKDGHGTACQVDANYRFMQNRANVFGALGYEDNSADAVYESYGQWKARLGVSLEIPWDMTLTLTGKYNDKRYDGEDPKYGARRNDGKYTGACSVSRNLYFDWLSAEVDFSYSKNDSNIRDYKYERKVATVSVAAKF